MDESKRECSGSLKPIDVQLLWKNYEDIAMHFNDLLMRLRSQSLAGIAAIATLVGVFAKDGGPGPKTDWAAATPILLALELIWIAIFCLDIFYYNRLLSGAVAAITALESGTKSEAFRLTEINMSTIIDKQFESGFQKSDFSRFAGVFWFYGIVFSVIAIGIGYSWHMSAISS